MYCVKCRKSTPSVGLHKVTTSNNRLQACGKCKTCGCKKCQFISSSTGAKGGSFFDDLF